MLLIATQGIVHVFHCAIFMAWYALLNAFFVLRSQDHKIYLFLLKKSI